MRSKNIVILIISIFICFTACQSAESQEGKVHSLQQAEATETKEGGQQADTDSIYVYVCGAVVCEGVYELPSGSRVYEAIAAAGGFREDAATSQINQAEIMEDEARIYVPTVEELMQSGVTGNGKVNINRASKEELMTLPGVGESRAESIIQYRETNGAFGSIEDIMQILGIKEALFEKIKDLITV